MRFIGKEMSANRFIARNFLVVDGYNIINAWQSLKIISETDLGEARKKLIDNIMEYSKLKGYEAYVVFDAYNVSGRSEKEEDHNGVTVVFTKENQTVE